MDDEKVDEGKEPVSVVEADSSDEEVRIVEPDEIEVMETKAQTQARVAEQKPQPPKKSNLGIIMVFFLAIFIMFDPNLRQLIGGAVGTVLDPVIGFDSRFPVLTIVIAGIIMVTFSTVVRHFFVDWLKLARHQNITRAFQAASRKARMDRDTKRMNELQKAQMDMLGMQQELTGMQMKPMAFTMLVIIPMFTWMFNFVAGLDYHFFSAPWNLTVNMFTTDGIVFGSSVLPHWILLYSLVSIPFSSLLAKGLKVLSWRKRVDHVLSDHPDVHAPGQ